MSEQPSPLSSPQSCPPSSPLRKINWEELFPFVRLFKAFRMAIQPSKIGLALAGVVLMGLWGGLLDGIWGIRPSAKPAESESITLQGGALFTDGAMVESWMSRPIITKALPITPEKRGVFVSFLKYQRSIIGNFLHQGCRVAGLDWEAVARNTNSAFAGREVLLENVGMLGTGVLMIRGWWWLISLHTFFAILFIGGSLAIWAVLGGAICRMAALHITRDELITPKVAIDFSTRKFASFFTAPMLPFAMIGAVGLLIWLCGFLLKIPYVGDLIGGPLVILALFGGFVMTLILVGMVLGGKLLWPTIAMEGSDGFDAMSRSYNYSYAKPVQMIFYTIVAAVYAGLSYTVLHLFAFVMLRLTRGCLGASVSLWSKRPNAGDGASKIDVIWPMPQPDHLLGQWSDATTRVGWDAWSAFFIWLWVLLLQLVLCAFLVSFLISASTIIYTLLRKLVDATDYEDVFVEEEDETESQLMPVTATTSEPPPPSPTPTEEAE